MATQPRQPPKPNGYLQQLFGPKPAATPRALAHIVTGLYGTTVANASEEKGGYRPAIVDQIPAAVGAVTQLVTGKPSEQAWARDALRRAELADSRAREQIGVTQVGSDTGSTTEKLGEGALEVIGAGIPGVVRGIPKVAGAVEKAVTNIFTPKTVAKAPTAARVAGKAANVATQVAGEVVLPLRQVSPRAYTAVAVPANAAISAGAEKIQQARIEKEAVNPPVGMEDFSSVQITTQEEFDAFRTQLAAIEAEEQAEQSDAGNAWATGMLALGVLAGGTYAYKQLKQQATTPLNLTGTGVDNSSLSTGQKLVTEVFDQNKPLRVAADKFLGPRSAERMNWALDTMSNTSYGARTDDFLTTGKAPMMYGLQNAFAGVRYMKVAPMLDSYATELDAVTQKRVADAVLAASELDDRALLGKPRSFQDRTDVELMKEVNTVRNDKQLGKYFYGIQQANRDLLDIELRAGLISQQKHQEMLLQRPNYVQFDRASISNVEHPDGQPYSANKLSRYARQEEGIASGEAANPFMMLPDKAATTIREAGNNAFRRNFLFQLEQMQARRGTKLVERVQKPNDFDDKTYHTVYKDGEAVHFKVHDAELARALHFYPRATTEALEAVRQTFQNFTTGPVGTLSSGFGLFRSPIYDTTAGILLRPKGMNFGIINQMLDRATKGKAGIVFDPTMFLEAYRGAAGHLKDSITQRMMTHLDSAVFRNEAAFGGLLNPQQTQAAAKAVSAMYERGLKHMLDRVGATSSTLYGAQDPTQPIVGMANISPKFANAQARDIFDEAGKGNYTPLQQALAQSRSAWVVANSNKLSRTYMMLLDATHNGFRRAAADANKYKIKDMEELGSRIRRVSLDPSNYGANKTLNYVNSSTVYSNVALQAFYEIGRRFKEDGGAHLAANFASFAIPLAAAHIAALSLDEEALQRHINKSVEQRATSVTLSGGVEIPLDPMTLPIVAPLMSVLHHASGAEDGNVNWNVVQGLLDMIEDDGAWEVVGNDAYRSFKQGLGGQFPYMPANNIPIGAGAAIVGVDPGQARFGDVTRPVQTQGMSGFDPDAALPNDNISAYTQNLVGQILGGTGSFLMMMANDVSKAVEENNSFEKVADIAYSRWADTFNKGAGPFSSVTQRIFGDRVNPGSVNDITNTQFREKNGKIMEIGKIYERDFKAAGRTHVENGAPTFDDRQYFQMTWGTPLEAVAVITNDLVGNPNYQALARQVETLDRQILSVKGQSNSTINERNTDLKDLIQRRKVARWQQALIVRDYETRIGQLVGNRKFRYEDFDPADYQQ